jgi:hypothetical protein
MTTKQGTKMPKATSRAGDIISDLIDALRERQVEGGSTYADASAFTLGYIGSALGGFIDGLTPKARATILADLEFSIRTVNDNRAKRRAEAIMARSASI